MNKQGAIVMVVLGSIIAIIGVVLYLMAIMGASGLILIGVATELSGIYFYWRNKKSNQ
ncbi:hypothetical protein [Nonlabens xiamenensis]|uniref:hypothetical protein n=1 Tax=Nonlabens xiamenensis TaxID=2341043 RepID=UPI0013DE27FD|nr:hypothetical protein [Nonlabens xiamenensis]